MRTKKTAPSKEWYAKAKKVKRQLHRIPKKVKARSNEASISITMTAPVSRLQEIFEDPRSTTGIAQVATVLVQELVRRGYKPEGVRAWGREETLGKKRRGRKGA